MRFHNFWCISFVLSEFLKHVQKTPKSWKKVCSITIFHHNPGFSCHLFFRQSWTKVLGQFGFSGRFSIHTGPTPPLTTQTMLDGSIQNFFRVLTLYRVGRENCEKIFRKTHSFKREPRNDRKYEYCITVPRAFVQDCRSH